MATPVNISAYTRQAKRTWNWTHTDRRDSCCWRYRLSLSFYFLSGFLRVLRLLRRRCGGEDSKKKEASFIFYLGPTFRTLMPSSAILREHHEPHQLQHSASENPEKSTFHPLIGYTHLTEVKHMLSGAKKWVLKHFRGSKSYDDEDDNCCCPELV